MIYFYAFCISCIKVINVKLQVKHCDRLKGNIKVSGSKNASLALMACCLLTNEEIELENFPKKDIEIKKRIKDISYELLELVYRANLLEEPKEKKNLLIKAIAKVKIIDFLINLSYDRELLPQKRYIKLSEKLDDIVKYISGLLKTYNKQQ